MAADPKTEAVEEGHWIVWETRQKHLREAALRLWDAAQAAMPCYWTYSDNGPDCIAKDYDVLCPSCTARSQR